MTIKSPAQDVAERLQTLGHGTIGATTGWAIAVGREPDKPINCITIYDTGGEDLDTDEQDIGYPSIMVRTRSRDYLVGYNKQRDIQKVLATLGGFATASARYRSWKSTSSIAQADIDDANNAILTANYSGFCELLDADT